MILVTNKGIRTKRRVIKPNWNIRIKKNTGTAGAHIGETASGQDNTGASKRSSFGAHVSDVTKTSVPSTQSVLELLVAHLVDNPI